MIEVIRTGNQICIVDMGRFGFRRYGVPISGAMDLRSAARANSLLHNQINEALLEVYMPGHQLAFHESGQFSITGAETEIHLDDKRIYGNEVYSYQVGTRLSIGNMSKGCRLYIAFKGGIDSAIMLKSRSPIPGFLNRSLSKGDKIQIKEYPNQQSSSAISSLEIDVKKKISCYAGPEWHVLQKKQQDHILQTPFSIDLQSDRMGYRLNGTEMKGLFTSILSSTVMPGTVQLLPSGLPIILMRDCQTTGGYPRILQIQQSDLNQLAQRRPGDEIHFELL